MRRFHWTERGGVETKWTECCWPTGDPAVWAKPAMGATPREAGPSQTTPGLAPVAGGAPRMEGHGPSWPDIAVYLEEGAPLGWWGQVLERSASSTSSVRGRPPCSDDSLIGGKRRVEPGSGGGKRIVFGFRGRDRCSCLHLMMGGGRLPVGGWSGRSRGRAMRSAHFCFNQTARCTLDLRPDAEHGGFANCGGRDAGAGPGLAAHDRGGDIGCIRPARRRSFGAGRLKKERRTYLEKFPLSPIPRLVRRAIGNGPLDEFCLPGAGCSPV